MTRREIKEFIQAGAEYYNIPFNTGRISEFNSSRSNTYPFIFLETPSVSTSLTYSLPTDTWTIQVHICYKDSQDSKMEEYESLIDQADEKAQKLLNKYNNILDMFNTVVLGNIRRVPFIKRHADCLTGVILSFDLIAQDVSGCD